MQNESKQDKCQHPNCYCSVQRGEMYCSDYCKNTANDQDADGDPMGGSGHGRCECGHDACRQAQQS